MDKITHEDESQVSFAEVPFNVNKESLCVEEKNLQPAAVVEIASVSLSFSNEANPELAAGIIREVWVIRIF